MIVLDVLLIALALLLAIPVGVLFTQVVAAVLLRTKPVDVSASPRPRIAVLVPAHNEALVIEATLARVQTQLVAGDRLLVVADNCSDKTADIARAAGAEVLERFDPTRRGKGYALDHGVRHLTADPAEVVVIVDADCDVTPGALETVSQRCIQTGRPVQALYLTLLGADNKSVSPIAAFAWRVRNLVRPLGLLHMGMPCHLMGSGMAIPWTLLCDLPLASGHIVEDMQMGVDLARRGAPPLFCPEALVTSTFPVSREGARAQRTRWEHGHIGMIVSVVPMMLRDAARGVGTGMLPLALDLLVPPQALLALLLLALWGLCALSAAFGASVWPLGSVSIEMGLFAASAMVAWARFARDTMPISEAPRFLLYVLAKIPLYLGFFVQRQVEWVRSKRDAD
jgi:cellulose synthase/poly-beta-1,6-N-acetylglucosamine synthase-like glycosyltransferase